MAYKISLFVMSLVFAASCSFTTGGTNESDEKPPLIETRVYERQSDGSYLLSVNDPSLVDSDGTTFLAYDADVIENGVFSFGVSLCKLYGDQNGGFGLIFQRTDMHNFWVFDIDVRGYYYLAKVSDGVERAVLSPPWQYSTSLNTGYGSTNVLVVSYDGNTNYAVQANGHEITNFTDTGLGDRLRGGCFGINTTLMPGEDFPETPVRVSFKIETPVSIILETGIH